MAFVLGGRCNGRRSFLTDYRRLVWALDVIRGTKTDVLHLQAFIEKKIKR